MSLNNILTIWVSRFRKIRSLFILAGPKSQIVGHNTEKILTYTPPYTEEMFLK